MLAWLGTAPQPDPARRAAQAGAAPPRLTRWESFRSAGQEPILPPVPCPQILRDLMEVGPVQISGGERAPVSWAELRAWSAGRNLPHWHLALLRHLSSAYLAELREAEVEARPAPFWQAGGHIDVEANERQLRAALRGTA